MSPAPRLAPDLVAAVIGSPVSHSLTPSMYRAVLGAASVAGSCAAIECGVDDVAGLLESARSSSLRGLSVTMPLKEEAARHLDDLDDVAASLGAVNSIVVSDGRLTGHNTDGDGCCDALVDRGGATIAGSRAVVLGAGGTARSVALALGRRGAHVKVVNRTLSHAVEVAERVAGPAKAAGGSVVVGAFDDVPGSTIVVNTTSVGMNSTESVVPASMLGPHHVVLDAVYQPLETALLASARRAGARCIDGLWMLVHQARRQIAVQFSLEAEAATMRAAAEAELAGRRQ